MFADLTTFRNKLAVGTSIFFIVGVVLSTLGARAWLIVKEQEKNARQSWRFCNNVINWPIFLAYVRSANCQGPSSTK
jgi:hypothetical protein